MVSFFDKYFPFILFYIFFWIIIWVAMSVIVARLSGWSALANDYRGNNSFPEKRWHMCSAGMRLISHYSFCVNVGADNKGLYMSILLPFRIGHPPLFIPWAEISVAEKKDFIFSWLVLTFKKDPEIPIRINKRLGNKIKSSYPSYWPG